MAEEHRQPIVVLPGEACVYDIGGGEARILVGAAQSGAERWLARVRSDHDLPAAYLVAGSPAGFEVFLAEIPGIVPTAAYGTPRFFARLDGAYRRYDSEIVGPPPVKRSHRIPNAVGIQEAFA